MSIIHFWDKYPNTDYYRVQLDYILDKIKDVDLAATELPPLAQEAQQNAQAAQDSAQAAKDSAQSADASAQAANQYAQSIGDTTSGIVSSWLDSHVNPDTGYVLDNTLSISGAAADSLAVGSALNSLKQGMFERKHFNEYEIDTKYNQGGLRTTTGGAISASNRLRSLYNAVMDKQSIVVPDGLKICIFVYGGTEYTSYLGVYNKEARTWDSVEHWYSGTVDITDIPAGFYIRFMIGLLGDGNITPSYMDTAALLYKVPAQHAVLKILELNTGRFNRGQSSGQYITPENWPAIKNAYIQLFKESQPNIGSFIESESSITVGTNTIDLNAAIFTRTLPHTIDFEQYAGATMASKRSVKADIVPISSENIRFEASYTYSGNTRTCYSYGIVAVYNVNGAHLAVLNAAAPSGTGEEQKAQRRAMLQVYADYLTYYDCAIMAIDANYGGSLSSSMIESEAAYNDILKPAGYLESMGDYFPYHYTWQSVNTGSQQINDNIYYKNNGRLTIKSFECLDNYAGILATDHLPITATFILQ